MSNKTATYTIRDNDIFMDEAHSVSAGTRGAKSYILKFKELPEDERPRERMLKFGPGALTLAELLAIVLGTGTVKEDVLEMSARILKEYGEQAVIGRTNAKELADSLNVPIGKAMQIVATGEIGRRFYDKKAHTLPVIRTAQDVHSYVKDMYNLPKEHLRGIYLNTHHRIIHDEVISIGTLNSNLVHPREVFKPGIEYGAAGIILVHNHPSGEVTPSSADIEITRQLVEVGKVVGINIIDHVIVTAEKFVSINVEY